MNDEDDALKSVINRGDSDQEFIVALDFYYCDVNYVGYRILSRAEIANLVRQLEKDCEVGTLNMPGSWYEEFHISALNRAFTIYSKDAKDVEKMRDLFGESVGDTGYFDLILYDLEDSSNSDEAGEEGEDDIETPNVIDREVAERFLEHEYSIDLEEMTSITDDAAIILAQHEGDLFLGGLTELSDATAASLSKQVGELYLDGLTELSDAAAEALAEHECWLSLRGLTKLSDAAAESLAKHRGHLFLDGLQQLSDPAAESLTKLEGDLSLDGLTELSDSAAESLGNHVGDLSFNGLTELPEVAAQSLSKCGGNLTLNKDLELTQSVADILSQRKGPVNGMAPNEWMEWRNELSKIMEVNAEYDPSGLTKRSLAVFEHVRDVGEVSLSNLVDDEGLRTLTGGNLDNIINLLKSKGALLTKGEE